MLSSRWGAELRPRLDFWAVLLCLRVDACELQGIRLAAGELVLRLAEERRRRAVMAEAGPLQEVRMSGPTGASPARLMQAIQSL